MWYNWLWWPLKWFLHYCAIGVTGSVCDSKDVLFFCDRDPDCNHDGSVDGGNADHSIDDDADDFQTYALNEAVTAGIVVSVICCSLCDGSIVAVFLRTLAYPKEKCVCKLRQRRLPPVGRIIHTRRRKDLEPTILNSFLPHRLLIHLTIRA